MEAKLICPPSFNIRTSAAYRVFKDFNPEYDKAFCDNISVKTLNDIISLHIFSATGKLWSEFQPLEKLIFEEVKYEFEITDKTFKHYHTEFYINEHRIHIDYVIAISYGPGSSQHNVRIYVNDELYTSAIQGGMLGGHWSQRWPATIIADNFLLRVNSRFNGKEDKLEYNGGDDDFPLILCQPISPSKAFIEIYDFNSTELSNRLINLIDLNEINYVFHPSAQEHEKLDFFEVLLKKTNGHFFSQKALLELVISEIFHNYNESTTCIFKEKSNDNTIYSKDRLLIEGRAGILTWYILSQFESLNQ